METNDKKAHGWLFVITIFVSIMLGLNIAGFLTDLKYQKQKVNPFRELSQQDLTNIVTMLANKYNADYDYINKNYRFPPENTEPYYLVNELGVRYMNNILDVLNQSKLEQEAKKGRKK